MRNQDFPGGPLAKTLHSQYIGLRLDPSSGDCIPHAATRYPACCNKDRRFHKVRLRLVQSNKQINIFKKRERETTKAENAAALCAVFVDIGIPWGRGLSLP